MESYDVQTEEGLQLLMTDGTPYEKQQMYSESLWQVSVPFHYFPLISDARRRAFAEGRCSRPMFDCTSNGRLIFIDACS